MRRSASAGRRKLLGRPNGQLLNSADLITTTPWCNRTRPDAHRRESKTNTWQVEPRIGLVPLKFPSWTLGTDYKKCPTPPRSTMSILMDKLRGFHRAPLAVAERWFIKALYVRLARQLQSKPFALDFLQMINPSMQVFAFFSIAIAYLTRAYSACSSRGYLMVQVASRKHCSCFWYCHQVWLYHIFGNPMGGHGKRYWLCAKSCGWSSSSSEYSGK